MKRQLYELQQKMSLPLELKIVMTQRRIRDWYNYYDGYVYLSFSGGLDSTVLKHIIDNTPGVHNVPSVFIDTGLEYPEIRKFVRLCKEKDSNVEIIRPKMTFRNVIEKYGYPVISKEVSRRVQYAKKAIADGREANHGDYLKLCGLAVDRNGNKSQFNCEQWKFLLDADFNCSAECCTVMKKKPAKEYADTTGRVPIIGTMTDESRLRKEQWMLHGCNAFDSDRPQSKPISFWTKQDILEYALQNKIQYCSVYGKIVRGEDGKLFTTGCYRTGCIFCMYGCHLEHPENRFQKLKETHPNLYNYCINGGDYNNGVWQPTNEGLGIGHILDYIGVDYIPARKPRKLFNLK